MRSALPRRLVAKDRTVDPAKATGWPSGPAFKAREIVFTCAQTHLSPSLMIKVCMKDDIRSLWSFAKPSSIASLRFIPKRDLIHLCLCTKELIDLRTAFNKVIVADFAISSSSK